MGEVPCGIGARPPLDFGWSRSRLVFSLRVAGTMTGRRKT